MKITSAVRQAVLKENASKGGKSTVKKYGKKHMTKIVNLRWAKRKAKLAA